VTPFEDSLFPEETFGDNFDILTRLPRREANSGGDAKQRGPKETPKLFPNVSELA